jgi:Ala-tRNA(Pro) deacylase
MSLCKEVMNMAVSILRKFLEENNVKYHTLTHSQAFTSQETAESAQISGKELAKTIMVKIDGNMAMAVLPASHTIHFGLLKKATGAKKVELASEEEFEGLFPECEPGAMPPFGNLYGMEVFVAEQLGEDEEISFNAGTHTELIKLAYRDFERLVHPRKAQFIH